MNRAFVFYALLSGFIFIGAIAWALQGNVIMTAVTGVGAYAMAVDARRAYYGY